MTQYVLADAARSDLLEIRDYLAEHAGLAIADRVTGDLHSAMIKLAQFPMTGHLREDLTNHPVRFWAVHSYYVIYYPDSSPSQSLGCFTPRETFPPFSNHNRPLSYTGVSRFHHSTVRIKPVLSGTCG